MSIVSENSLSTEAACLWKPLHPENTHMEKFRLLMQTKYTNAKLGKFIFSLNHRKVTDSLT
jgi:hypothetical protein